MAKDTRQKVTIYSQGMYGMRKVEGKLVKYGTRKSAQYNNDPYVHFVPTRERNIRFLGGLSTSPYLLVLEGHGHPDTEEEKYPSCDERYETDLDAILDKYIEETGTAIIADYRYTKGFSSHPKVG